METLKQVLRAVPASRAPMADEIGAIYRRADLDPVTVSVALSHLEAIGWVRRIDVPHATYWARTYEADQLRWL